MTETTKNSGEKLSVSSTKTLTLEARRRRAGRRAPKLQPWSQQGGRGREGETPRRRSGRGQAGTGRAGRARRGAQARPSMSGQAGALPLRRRLAAPRRSPPAWCCARSPRKSAAPARMRLPTRACARRKSARSPRKKRASGKSREEAERAERAAAEPRKREEEERRKHDEETKRKADEVAKKRFGADDDDGLKPSAPRPALRSRRRGSPAHRPPRRPRRGRARPAPAPKTPRRRAKSAAAGSPS